LRRTCFLIIEHMPDETNGVNNSAIYKEAVQFSASFQWWANPKSNPQPLILNLWTPNPKSEKANPKSQIANTQIKINTGVATGGHVPTLPRPGWVVRFAQIRRVFLHESGWGGSRLSMNLKVHVYLYLL